jgi:hypothetical protein
MTIRACRRCRLGHPLTLTCRQAREARAARYQAALDRMMAVPVFRDELEIIAVTVGSHAMSNVLRDEWMVVHDQAGMRAVAPSHVLVASTGLDEDDLAGIRETNAWCKEQGIAADRPITNLPARRQQSRPATRRQVVGLIVVAATMIWSWAPICRFAGELGHELGQLVVCILAGK